MNDPIREATSEILADVDEDVLFTQDGVEALLRKHFARVIADAMRYQYLKSEARGSSPHMRGHMRLYCFRHISNEGGAPDLDAAIDAKMRET